jgi:hypothetical protein
LKKAKEIWIMSNLEEEISSSEERMYKAFTVPMTPRLVRKRKADFSKY